MYAISSSDAFKFLTTDFMPVSTDSTQPGAMADGAIESLIVTLVLGIQMELTTAVFGDGTSQNENPLVRLWG